MLTKSIFELVGGDTKLDAFIDEFVSRIKENSELGPMYPDDMTHLKASYKEYATELFGGPKLFSRQDGARNLHQAHQDIEITRHRADEMLKCAMDTMDHFGIPKAVQSVARGKIQEQVYSMVNA